MHGVTRLIITNGIYNTLSPVFFALSAPSAKDLPQMSGDTIINI